MLDTDNQLFEDAIFPEELDYMETEDAEEAYALNSELTDMQADEDRLPEEDWTGDLPDTETPEEADQPRK